MSNFVENTNNNGSGTVKSISVSKKIAAEVKEKVSIPMYFYSIVVPQLGNYYDNYPVNFDNKAYVCCPLHDEDTPSMRYYEETNSFYCFGCSRGGDVIQLHRYFTEKINGTMPTRDEAINFLYQYFIKGRETETFIQKPVASNEKLNSDSDIVKLNMYRFNLEQSITFDNHINMELKQKFWGLLDNIDVLLSKNMIKATEAETYLKQQVRELIK